MQFCSHTFFFTAIIYMENNKKERREALERGFDIEDIEDTVFEVTEEEGKLFDKA